MPFATWTWVGPVLALAAACTQLLFALRATNLHKKKKRRLTTKGSAYQPPPPPSPPSLDPENILKYVILLLIVVAALYVMISHGFDQDTKKWAAGAIGLVLGSLLGSKSK